MQRANGIEYEVRGEGEPVLLIHGSFLPRSLAPLIEELALVKQYRVIRYHRRSFSAGDRHAGPFSIADQARDALAVLEHAGGRQGHVVGHSYGGAIALQLALDAPDAVRSLFLVEPAIYTQLNPKWGELFAEAFAMMTSMYRAGDVRGAGDRFMQAAAGPDWVRELEAVLPGASEEALRDGAVAAFEAELPSLAEWQFDEEIARRIAQPVAYVTGSHSSPIQEPAKATFQSWVPHAEGIIIPGANHAMPYLAPAQVATAAVEFMAKQPIGAEAGAT